MIEKYRHQFTKLNVARMKGQAAPHKAILLLAILEMIEFDLLKQNRITVSDDLTDAFSYIWKRYIGESTVFKDDIQQPYWYMKSEPFWTLCHSDGSIVISDETKPSLTALKLDYYAQLDVTLYELLHNQTSRATLRVALISKYLTPQDGTMDKFLPAKESLPLISVEKRCKRSPAQGLRVHLPDGRILYNKISVKTLIEAVQLVGPAKVASLGLECCNIPLVTDRLSTTKYADQEAIGQGYYIMKKNSTERKALYLKSISEAFNLGWRIEVFH